MGHIPLYLTVHYQFALQLMRSPVNLQSSRGSSVMPRTSDTWWVCQYAHITWCSCSGWSKRPFSHTMIHVTSQQTSSSPVSITGHISSPMSVLYNHHSNNPSLKLMVRSWPGSGFRGNQYLNTTQDISF